MHSLKSLIRLAVILDQLKDLGLMRLILLVAVLELGALLITALDQPLIFTSAHPGVHHPDEIAFETTKTTRTTTTTVGLLSMKSILSLILPMRWT